MTTTATQSFPAAADQPMWRGQWLWLAEDAAQAQTAVLLRRTFELDGPAPQAVLRISAAHIYRVYLNGREIGRGPARSDPRFRYFDAYAVADALRPGTNRIVCLVHHLRPFIAGDHRQWNLYDGPGGLLADLDLGGFCVATDEQWQITRAPGWRDTSVTGHRFHPAIHDVDIPTFTAALETVLAGQDDLAWQTPACRAVGSHELYGAPQPTGTARPRELWHEPVRIRSVFTRPRHVDPRPKSAMLGLPRRAVVIHPSPEGGWLQFDLPHAMAGRYELTLYSDEPATIDVYCGEGSEQHISDRLHVLGLCRFQPLDWRGGDRVAMHVRESAGPVEMRGFRFMEWQYPYEPRGDFHCDRDMLNRLWRIGRRTAWQGTQDHLVDCVWREQALWIEDVFVHCQSIGAAFGDMRPVAKAVRQSLQLIDERGIVPVPGPGGIGYRKDNPQLRWSGQPLALPMIAREHYWRTRDPSLASWCLERFEALLRFYGSYEDPRGLLNTHPPGAQSLECFGGWDPYLKVGVPTALNGMYAVALSAASDLAGRLGRDALAESWGRRARRVVEALQTSFWDEDRCALIDGERDGKLVRTISPTPNAWAALAGAVPANRAGAWAETLRRSPAARGPTTTYDASVLLMALAKMDVELHVRELLDHYFGSIVRHGHPTLPEYWRADDPTMVGTLQDSSRCHAFGTGPVFVSQTYILGVRPLEPGYGELLIRPRALGLRYAAGRVPTPHGDVVVQWRRDAAEAAWAVTVELPAGVAATVELPWGRESLYVNGELAWCAPRWAHAVTLRQPAEAANEPRMVRHRLAGAGRHTLRLEPR